MRDAVKGGDVEIKLGNAVTGMLWAVLCRVGPSGYVC